MNKYTVEQVDACILCYKSGDLNYCRQGIVDLLTDYAAILRERESAKAAVTDEMVDIALTTMYGEQFADISGKAEEIFRQHMRAALEAVAPMLASADNPTERDSLRFELIEVTEERDHLRKMLASARVPDGWQLVPVEATDEMCEAAWESDASDYVGEHRRIHRADLAYKAMLAVAPKPETKE